MIVADVANFVLGGIPGEVHDLFVTDVEPADLAQASALLQAMSDSAGTIHVKLSGSVVSLEGRWQGDGAATFDNEIWQPLSHGLGVLQGECVTAATELARLAVQAEQAHLYKVEELNQKIQNQLWIYAGTSLIGGPELGGLISDAVGGLAARLGGELVGRMVTGIVDTITTLLRKVLDAFYDLLKWAAKPLTVVTDGMRAEVNRIVGMISSREGAPTLSEEQLTLMTELQAAGTKISPGSVIDIQRLADGGIVWLETGGVKSGLTHILERHASDFLNKGISAADIPTTIFRALRDGKIVGCATDGTPLRALTVNGKPLTIKVVIGSNGYIVSAFPTS